MHINVYVYIYIYLYLYTYIHTCIHTRTQYTRKHKLLVYVYIYTIHTCIQTLLALTQLSIFLFQISVNHITSLQGKAFAVEVWTSLPSFGVTGQTTLSILEVPF